MPLRSNERLDSRLEHMFCWAYYYLPVIHSFIRSAVFAETATCSVVGDWWVTEYRSAQADGSVA